MRRLNIKKAVSFVKELDTFPKVPETYVVTSAFGGTVSLSVFILVALLSISEFLVYQDTWMKYEYEVDADFSSKLKIKIDITVAMKCERVGADVLDISGAVVASKELKYEPVNFESTPQQKVWYQILQQIQSRLREEHSLRDVLFKSALKGRFSKPIPWNYSTSVSRNACRIHGQIYVSKVAGNFHITLGKPINTIRGHAHFASLIKTEVHNFSHRIDCLSFGNDVPGHINPLDGTEKITLEQNQLFQYFVTVVPTKLHTSDVSVDMHQFSVTERERVINFKKDSSHGVSGIFIKYNLSPLMVRVSEEHMPLSVFLVRLCGIIGGIFATSDFLHSMIVYFVDIICCRYKVGTSPRR
ncbi:endoplasmic reticulum-Golgi intermediate compartment protein 2 [Xyrauchen texanus]|uniref:endoplasmic reticulum-Golgi intermediate compartment protein 2 n=1 Tax=Xyrauchen texanus TaxID=154827 RepID=UPI0022421C43|nr:endoplasmic reticulum-Golgi intermediate compartment protein 2 [Xyrauchen texanus]